MEKMVVGYWVREKKVNSIFFYRLKVQTTDWFSDEFSSCACI